MEGLLPRTCLRKREVTRTKEIGPVVSSKIVVNQLRLRQSHLGMVIATADVGYTLSLTPPKPHGTVR